ncbi:YqaJ viral recombinase family protein [Prescottella equi]|uniref:YqaJ viral recombinase family protein n=1 Tax=Rhodococcus hoagii TaxID=43767 RepID=UPI0023DCC371|nr:YqaJ viral recombinase family protein [Prescottella equi]
MNLTGIRLDVDLIPGSPEWLATYSASQVAAICGLSEWDTPRSIYDAKKGIVPAQPQTDVQGRGHQFEPLIRGWVAEQNPDWWVEETGTWAHRERTWQTANPDALISTGFLDDDAVVELLEIKTAADMHEWGEVPPIKYLVQCMWQMDVIGARRTHLAACGPFELFHRRPRMFVIDYNPREAAMLREKVLEFDAMLRAGIQPPANHDRECDRLAVRYGNTAIVDDPGVEIPDELAELYLGPYAEAAAVEAAKKSGASRLLEFLGESKKATYRGTTIATRIAGRGDKPPTLRAANGLAEKAADLLNANESDSNAA